MASPSPMMLTMMDTPAPAVSAPDLSGARSNTRVTARKNTAGQFQPRTSIKRSIGVRLKDQNGLYALTELMFVVSKSVEYFQRFHCVADQRPVQRGISSSIYELA
jgi:hypothetical protein